MPGRAGPPSMATQLHLDEGGRAQAFVSLSREHEEQAFSFVLKQRGFEVHHQLNRDHPLTSICLAIIDDLSDLANAVSYFKSYRLTPDIYFFGDAKDDEAFAKAEAIGATHALTR